MRTLRRVLIWLAVSGCLVISPSPNWTDEGISREAREAVVKTLAGAIRDGYVLEKAGERIADELLVLHAQGEFEGDATPDGFASSLTRKLFEISGDRHLRVSLRGRDPAGAGCEGGAGAGEGGGGEGQPGPEHRRVLRMAPESNFSSRVLAGGVGLLEVGILTPPLEAMERSLKDLAGSDALIVDVRRCPGGSMDAIRDLASVFFEKPEHLVTHRIRGGEPFEVHTGDRPLAGARFAGKPAFILTSNRTGSGCEEFAFDIKYHDRAVVVGEKTAGAGHGLVGSLTDLGYGLEALVPNMRPEHPRFPGGFEGIGVPPDVAVPASAALMQAHQLALASLIETEKEPGRRAELERTLLEVSMEHAREMRRQVASERRLRPLAGAYEGGKRLVIAGGELRLEDDSGRVIHLEEEGTDTYAMLFTPGQKLRIVRDRAGTVVALEISGPGGEGWKRSPRMAES